MNFSSHLIQTFYISLLREEAPPAQMDFTSSEEDEEEDLVSKVSALLASRGIVVNDEQPGGVS